MVWQNLLAIAGNFTITLTQNTKNIDKIIFKKRKTIMNQHFYPWIVYIFIIFRNALLNKDHNVYKWPTLVKSKHSKTIPRVNI